MPPFTITVILGPDSHGRMVGNASVVAACLKTHRLQATVNGSNVVLAGSDADGDNVTFRGTLDSTGTLLTMNYILNGGAGQVRNGSRNGHDGEKIADEHRNRACRGSPAGWRNGRGSGMYLNFLD